MAKTIFAIFNRTSDAEGAINDLNSSVYDNDYKQNVSVIMRDANDAKRLSTNTGTDVASSTATGAATGGVVGLIAGLLLGVGAITLPPIGGIVIAGPLAAALGISTAAAATAAGGVIGALSGGLVGALVGLGVSKNDAQYYQDQLTNNKDAVLVGADANNEDENKIKNIFQNHHAAQIRVAMK